MKRCRTLFASLLIALSFLPINPIRAQEKKNGSERPIPIYIVCPYHNDSLRVAYERGLLPNSPNAALERQIDSLHSAVFKAARSVERRSAIFISLLYLLLAAGFVMNIVTFNFARKLKTELDEVRTDAAKRIADAPTSVEIEVVPTYTNRSTKTKSSIRRAKKSR